MKKWQDITRKRDQQQQWEKCSEQRKAAMDVINTSMVDVLPLFLRSVLHAEGIEMNLNMLIHYDDFHLSTLSIIHDNVFKPKLTAGKDIIPFAQESAEKALGFVARKVAPRLAPVIGWVILAKDVYDILND